MYVVIPRYAAAAVVSAVVAAPAKEYAHPYSMMHRRLTTAGIEVAPHYHQLLVLYVQDMLVHTTHTCSNPVNENRSSQARTGRLHTTEQKYYNLVCGSINMKISMLLLYYSAVTSGTDSHTLIVYRTGQTPRGLPESWFPVRLFVEASERFPESVQFTVHVLVNLRGVGVVFGVSRRDADVGPVRVVYEVLRFLRRWGACLLGDCSLLSHPPVIASLL